MVGRNGVKRKARETIVPLLVIDLAIQMWPILTMMMKTITPTRNLKNQSIKLRTNH